MPGGSAPSAGPGQSGRLQVSQMVIQVAMAALPVSTNQRGIVLLTDGLQNTPPNELASLSVRTAWPNLLNVPPPPIEPGSRSECF